MKKTYILSLIFLSFGFLQAQDQKSDECSQEMLLSYFPGTFVRNSLEKFKVPKSEWDAIIKELSIKDKEILKIVSEKASKMNPNPLRDPQQRQAAVKLFRETLFENFSLILKNHGITDEKQIQSLLDDIQHQKAESFAKCMQKRHSEEEEEEEDDDDENEDERK